MFHKHGKLYLRICLIVCYFSMVVDLHTSFGVDALGADDLAVSL